jgi:hypothetical protein
VKTFNLKFMRVMLLALVAGFSPLTTAPSWADTTPTVQAPSAPAPIVSSATRLAWDRVGSQERSFV